MVREKVKEEMRGARELGARFYAHRSEGGYKREK